jgi:iron complex outermembrane receptor protein
VNASPIPGIQAGIFVGATLPKTPSWKFNFGPRYETALGNGGSLVFLADWTHSSSLWNDIARTLATRRPANDMVNASVTYNAPSENWSLTLGGTNLADERFLTSGGANLAAGGIFGTYNRPREWYARLGFKF